jgi:hypothetical protein
MEAETCNHQQTIHEPANQPKTKERLCKNIYVENKIILAVAQGELTLIMPEFDPDTSIVRCVRRRNRKMLQIAANMTSLPGRILLGLWNTR